MAASIFRFSVFRSCKHTCTRWCFDPHSVIYPSCSRIIAIIFRSPLRVLLLTVVVVYSMKLQFIPSHAVTFSNVFPYRILVNGKCLASDKSYHRFSRPFFWLGLMILLSSDFALLSCVSLGTTRTTTSIMLLRQRDPSPSVDCDPQQQRTDKQLFCFDTSRDKRELKFFEACFFVRRVRRV